MIGSRIKILKDIASNVLSNKLYGLSYIVEPANWSIKWDGLYITKNLNKLNFIKARTTNTSIGLRNQIVHFGSVNTFLRKNSFQRTHKSNQNILTWFHFVPGDERNKNIMKAQKYLGVIHTSCNITKNNLIDLGVNPEKIVVIPLGVDLSIFKPVSFNEKQKIKKQLGIPSNKIVIGSFQKDGVGWGKGLEPKLIKGPDIFVKVVEKLAKNYPVFILLVGPARGYVETELQKRNIPYKNIGYLKDFVQLAKYYYSLDLYLITSRIEGGPKQILEAMASGIPIISTKVGMAPDIIKERHGALLSDVGDIITLSEKVRSIIEDKKMANQLVNNALNTVKEYSWERITTEYYEKIYKRFLSR